MLDSVERLNGFKVLEGLDKDELSLIAGIATLTNYPAGTILAHEGADADFLYLLTGGRALITTHNVDAGEGVLDEILPGEVLGWSAVTAPYRYTASAHVVEDSEAVAIPGADLRQLFNSEHHMGYVITQNMGHVISRRYGRVIGAWNELRLKDLRAFAGAEHVVWEDASNRLTNEALLLDTASESPQVIPLEVIYDVTVDGRCMIVKAKGGEVRSCPLDDPAEVAALVIDEAKRSRLAYRRVDD